MPSLVLTMFDSIEALRAACRDLPAGNDAAGGSLFSPALSVDPSVAAAMQHGVPVGADETVGVGVVEAWMARNTRLDIAWVCTSLLTCIVLDRSLTISRLPSSPTARSRKRMRSRLRPSMWRSSSASRRTACKET